MFLFRVSVSVSAWARVPPDACRRGAGRGSPINESVAPLSVRLVSGVATGELAAALGVSAHPVRPPIIDRSESSDVIYWISVLATLSKAGTLQ